MQELPKANGGEEGPGLTGCRVQAALGAGREECPHPALLGALGVTWAPPAYLSWCNWGTPCWPIGHPSTLRGEARKLGEWGQASMEAAAVQGNHL